MPDCAHAVAVKSSLICDGWIYLAMELFVKDRPDLRVHFWIKWNLIGYLAQYGSDAYGMDYFLVEFIEDAFQAMLR